MSEQDHEGRSYLLAWSIILMTGFVLLGSLILLQSCTLSFQNIMTIGESEDVVDQDPSTNVNPNITIPAKLM